jgi:Bifunctional DNA primase/polymerase, N-terminal/Primase C terminal 2 (PriCT-2)
MTPLDAARDYHSRGWRVLPIPPRRKGPVMRDWQHFEATVEGLRRLFGAGENLGVLLGRKSNDLADIDLDCPEALLLADLYLPVTRAEFGRKSKPRAHRLYIAPSANFEAFSDPTNNSTLLELRAEGREGGAHQTVFPPSLHPSGERIEWYCDVIAPRAVNARALQLVVARLAIACLVMRHISEDAARRPGPDLPRLLWEADHDLGGVAYRWLGQPDPDAPRRHPRPRVRQHRQDLDLAEVVANIPNRCDWENWNKIGLAIFKASGGSEEGFIIFDDFSARSLKYDPHVVEDRWRNYHRSPPSRISLGTLVHLAREAGWCPKTGN